MSYRLTIGQRLYRIIPHHHDPYEDHEGRSRCWLCGLVLRDGKPVPRCKICGRRQEDCPNVRCLREG